MSHFSVLVVAKDESELESKLLLYHEYESTGITAHTEFVPADVDELKTKYEEFGDGRDLEEFALDWGGWEKNEDGVFGRITNPNRKWDWWEIGGRWRGLLQLRDGSSADSALAGEIDWEGMLAKKTANRAESWDNWAGYINRVSSIENWFEMSVEEKLELLDEIEHTLTEGERRSESWIDALFFEPQGQTRETHVDANTIWTPTFAFVDSDGSWVGRGHMGWWAIISDENPDYNERFWQFVKSLPDDCRVYVVDCHI